MDKVGLRSSTIVMYVPDLANMLSIGTINASKVGEQAGAVVRIGNRKL